MSYLGGVLGHIAEAEFLGHFGGSRSINLRGVERTIGRCWCGGGGVATGDKRSGGGGATVCFVQMSCLSR